MWSYSISGLEVVKSWLNYRKREPSGRRSSPLDDIGPERWEFAEELLELLWVLEATIALEPNGAALLELVCDSDLFTTDELPVPTSRERIPRVRLGPLSSSLNSEPSPTREADRYSATQLVAVFSPQCAIGLMNEPSCSGGRQHRAPGVSDRPDTSWWPSKATGHVSLQALR